MSNNLFWVSPIASNWDSTLNWSTSSGGLHSSVLPDSLTIVYFDGMGLGGCSLTTDVTVAGIRMQPEYTGVVEQGANTITVGFDDCTFDGGFFEGGSKNINIFGNVHFGHTEFVCTDATAVINGNLYFEPHNSGAIDIMVFENITLTPLDIINKYVTLSDVPDPLRVVLNLVHGSTQMYGTDYYVLGDRLLWDSGMALDGLLTSGDELRIVFPVQVIPGFYHNNGTVCLSTRNTQLTGNGIIFHDLQFNGDSTSYCMVDSSAFIDGRLMLESGNIRAGTDSTLISEGDVSVLNQFGMSPYNDALIRMDSLGQQILYTDGGVIPSLYVDKTSTEQPVVCSGHGPVRINKDFILNTGIFNLNGLELKVGVQ